MGIPPTDKRVTVPGIHITRTEGGKIVENQQVVDHLELLQQLGAVRQPELAQSH